MGSEMQGHLLMGRRMSAMESQTDNTNRILKTSAPLVRGRSAPDLSAHARCCVGEEQHGDAVRVRLGGNGTCRAPRAISAAARRFLSSDASDASMQGHGLMGRRAHPAPGS